MSRLLIAGAGGHGVVVAEAAELEGRWNDIAFLDDKYEPDTLIESWPVVGSYRKNPDVVKGWSHFIVAIGNNEKRTEIADRLMNSGLKLTDIVHPMAFFSPRAKSAGGSMFLAGSVVNARATLGRYCIVNTGASVDHDCHLSEGVHIAPGAHLGANVHIGRLSSIGIGAAVREGMLIGHNTIVGAGAAVVAQVGNDCLVKGVPAK